MTGEEVAREVIESLSVSYSISSTRLLAVMRDRCSVNNVALRTIKVMYPDLVDIGCIAHTINLAGEKFKVPTLHDFINHWNSFFPTVLKLVYVGRINVDAVLLLIVQLNGGASLKS